MLKIGKFVFEDDWNGRRSSFMYFKGDEGETPSWSLDIGVAMGDFNGGTIVPSLCINPIDTKKEAIRDLVGESFSIMTIEESCDREDSHATEQTARYGIVIVPPP